MGKPRSEWKQPRRSPLKPRTSWLARGTEAIAKSARPRPKKKRTAAEEREKFAREYGPPGFLDWIHAQPSVASGRGPCVAAHLGTGGTSRKGDWTTIIPLLDVEHLEELHRRGPSWFEAKYGISLENALAATQARFQAHLAAVEGAA